MACLRCGRGKARVIYITRLEGDGENALGTLGCFLWKRAGLVIWPGWFCCGGVFGFVCGVVVYCSALHVVEELWVCELSVSDSSSLSYLITILRMPGTRPPGYSIAPSHHPSKGRSSTDVKAFHILSEPQPCHARLVRKLLPFSARAQGDGSHRDLVKQRCRVDIIFEFSPILRSCEDKRLLMHWVV